MYGVKFLPNERISNSTHAKNVPRHRTVSTPAPLRVTFSEGNPDLIMSLQRSTSVHVSTVNAPAAQHLVVAGYDVFGEVRSDGEPVKDVTFLLYSSTVSKEVQQHCSPHSGMQKKSLSCSAVMESVRFQDVSGCNPSPVEGADSGDSSLLYLCSAQSRDDGSFIFSSLASGEYTVVSLLSLSVQKLDLCESVLQL